MHNIDEYLLQASGPVDFTPSEYVSTKEKVEVNESASDLCDSAPIYNEAIDDNFARSVLGSRFKPNHIYKLITTETCTVISMFTLSGEFVQEFTLSSVDSVQTLTDLNNMLNTRGDAIQHEYGNYDLYEHKDFKLGYLVPILGMGVLVAIFIVLVIITKLYLL